VLLTKFDIDFTGNMLAAHIRQNFGYTLGDFEVSRPPGRYVAAMGMKFGVK